MCSQIGFEIIFEGKKLEEESNIYRKKAFANIMDFYQVLLEPYINDLNRSKSIFRIYVCESFNVEKVEYLLFCPILRKSILKILKPFCLSYTKIVKLNKRPITIQNKQYIDQLCPICLKKAI